MAAATSSSSSLTLSGTLYAIYSDQPWNDSPFNVYDEQQRRLASGKTDAHGRFSLILPTQEGNPPRITVIIRLCEEKLATSDTTSASDPTLREKVSFLMTKTETAESKRTVKVISGSANAGSIFPETEILPAPIKLSYLARVALATVPSAVTTVWNWFAGNTSIGQIQQSYDIPSVPLSARNTWKLLTNGICPEYFRKDGDHLVATFMFPYQLDTLNSLPEVNIFYKNTGTEEPPLEKIEVRFRETLTHSPAVPRYSPVKTYKHDDPNIQEGLRLANCALLVSAQTNHHLTKGHVYPSYVVQAINEELKGTALGKLLAPHTNNVLDISVTLGESAIYGKKGVLNVSALSPQGIIEFINDSMACIDPFTYEPRQPMYANHHFAHAQRIFFQMLVQKVGAYIDANWSQIHQEWTAVHRFFKTLHQRSPIYRPWNGVDPSDPSWFDANEIGGQVNPNAPARAKYQESDSGVRSFRPIATDARGAQTHDKEMIVRFCVHYIHMVTFWHSWVHRSQTIFNGPAPHTMDLNNTPITLQDRGRGAYGSIRPEDGKKQLFITDTFRQFDTAPFAIVKNKKVIPEIKQGISDIAVQLASHGIRVEEVQASTVI